MPVKFHDIKLNNRVSLRSKANSVAFEHRTIAVRVYTWRSCLSIYSGRRLRLSYGKAPSCRPLGKELISIDVPLVAR
jgi:hypothetical protein